MPVQEKAETQKIPDSLCLLPISFFQENSFQKLQYTANPDKKTGYFWPVVTCAMPVESTVTVRIPGSCTFS